MILHVDPDEASRSTVRDALLDVETSIRSVGSYGEAMEVIEEAETVEQLITEYDIGDGTGLDLIRRVRDLHPDITAILYTGTDVEDIESGGFEDVVVEFVRKGDENALDQLLDIVTFESSHHSQVSYPLPANEEARLAALSDYPTDSAELKHALDRLTALASAFFDVDIATAGIIEEHEEVFISCHNASFDSLDREDSFCTFTILEESINVIEDVREDSRFPDEVSHAGGEIRFYAGAPVRTPDGMAIGTFCLMDPDPRPFSDDDRHYLELFAAEAMDQFELRRRLEADSRGGTDVR